MPGSSLRWFDPRFPRSTRRRHRPELESSQQHLALRNPLPADFGGDFNLHDAHALGEGHFVYQGRLIVDAVAALDSDAALEPAGRDLARSELQDLVPFDGRDRHHVAPGPARLHRLPEQVSLAIAYADGIDTQRTALVVDEKPVLLLEDLHRPLGLLAQEVGLVNPAVTHRQGTERRGRDGWGRRRGFDPLG